MYRKAFFYSTILNGILICLFLPVFSSSLIPTMQALFPFGRPAWFGVAIEDARTGETFKINDFAGKVVLVQTIAQWCNTCAYQQK